MMTEENIVKALKDAIDLTLIEGLQIAAEGIEAEVHVSEYVYNSLCEASGKMHRSMSKEDESEFRGFSSLCGSDVDRIYLNFVDSDDWPDNEYLVVIREEGEELGRNLCRMSEVGITTDAEIVGRVGNKDPKRERMKYLVNAVKGEKPLDPEAAISALELAIESTLFIVKSSTDTIRTHVSLKANKSLIDEAIEGEYNREKHITEGPTLDTVIGSHFNSYGLILNDLISEDHIIVGIHSSNKQEDVFWEGRFEISSAAMNGEVTDREIFKKFITKEAVERAIDNIHKREQESENTPLIEQEPENIPLIEQYLENGIVKRREELSKADIGKEFYDCDVDSQMARLKLEGVNEEKGSLYFKGIHGKLGKYGKITTDPTDGIGRVGQIRMGINIMEHDMPMFEILK